MSVTVVHVAVGVLINEVGQVLLSKRGDNQHQGGLWEFPGGKVECDESVFDALAREFLEEVDVRILNAQPLLQISHDYGDKQVLLDVWLSRQPRAVSDARVFEGEARGKENQQIIWAEIYNLENYHFPEANKAIITRLKTLS
jgi:8-oxo-dGTP diphosphatase